MTHCPTRRLTAGITAAVLAASSVFAFAGMPAGQSAKEAARKADARASAQMDSNHSNKDSHTSRMSSSHMSTSSAMLEAVPSQGLKADLNDADKGCLKNAAQINLLEIKLGDLAQSNGKSQAVKDFGKRMSHDHHQLQRQLKALGEQVGGEVSDELDKSHQDTYDKMTKLNGSKFDSTYINAMVKGHKKAMRLAKKETRQGANLSVMNWAAEIHPILAIHEKLAKQAQKSVQAGGTTARQ